MKRMTGLLLLAVVVVTAYVAVVFFVVEPLVVYAFSTPETFDLLPSHAEISGFVGLALGWGMVAAISMVLIAVTILSLFREAAVTAIVGPTKMDVVDAHVGETGQERLPFFFDLSEKKSVPTAMQPRLVFDPRLAPVDWRELNGTYASSNLFERELTRFRSRHSVDFPSDMITRELIPFFRSQEWLSEDRGAVIFFCRVGSGRMAS